MRSSKVPSQLRAPSLFAAIQKYAVERRHESAPPCRRSRSTDESDQLAAATSAISYCALKRQFGARDEYIVDSRDEFIQIQRVASASFRGARCVAGSLFCFELQALRAPRAYPKLGMSFTASAPLR